MWKSHNLSISTDEDVHTHTRAHILFFPSLPRIDIKLVYMSWGKE